MSTDVAIDGYLEKVASGQTELLPDLLRHLGSEMLYTPVTEIENVGDSRGTNRIKVATLSFEDHSAVPSFTSDEHFLEWSDGKHQCFSVSAADLAMSLPQNSWLMLNPGLSSALELSPEEVSLLAAGEVGEKTIASSEENKYSSEQDYFDSGKSEFSRLQEEDIFRLLPQETPAVSSEEFAFLEQQVCADLLQVLRKHNEVEQAYFEETRDNATHVILGLFAKQLSPEIRFTIIDEIADISKRYYGKAGAIEVYDDLHIRASSSWELFKHLKPFYLRDAEATRTEPEKELRNQIISERSPQKSSLTRVASLSEENTSTSSAWGGWRKKAQSFFGRSE